MNKIFSIFCTVMLATLPAIAQADRDHRDRREHRNYERYHRYQDRHVHRDYHRPVVIRDRGKNDWIVPAIIGGTVVYLLTRPDGSKAETTTLPLPPNGFHYETITDMSCNCAKVVLVPNR